VDLRERRQLDVTTSMAKVRARARPWKAILSLLVALAAAAVAVRWGNQLVSLEHQQALRDSELRGGLSPADALQVGSTGTARALAYGGAAAFFIFGLAAAFGLSGTAGRGLRPAIGQAHAGIVRYAFLLVSLFVLLVVTLQLLHIPIAQLVVGGAVTGVLLGIAAQQSLANLFAGLVLLFAHPFRVGDHVRFRAGVLSGQIEGIITDVSLTYVRLETDEGRVLIPNSQALAAAVLLVPEPAPDSQPNPTATVV
jgi:small-conductance mechanosensitive channel